MGIIRRKVTETVVKKAVSYIEKDPINNINKVIGLASKIAIMPSHKQAISDASIMMENKNSMQFKLVERVTSQLSSECLKNFTINFFVNATLEGEPAILKNEEKYKCNIPWTIIMEPTSACNLKCKECASNKKYTGNTLGYTVMDKIIEEGKDLGIYVYGYIGGEPLVKKDEVLNLAEKHKDCIFAVLTNGTLIDDGFAEKVSKIGNMVFVFSIDGFEEETDKKRGVGTYRKIIKSMDILKANKVGFGFASSYDESNLNTVISEKYINFMVRKGCLFGALINNDVFKEKGKSVVLNESKINRIQSVVEKYQDTKPILLMNIKDRDEANKGYLMENKSYLYVDCEGKMKESLFQNNSNISIKDGDLINGLQTIKIKK